MKLSSIGAALGLAAGAMVLAGCTMHVAKEDLVGTHFVKVEVKPTSAVVLTAPTVRQEGDTLIIEGTVTRNDKMDTFVPGHVHVVIESKEGVLLENIPLEWKPDDIPTDAKRSSKYRMDYLWKMPKDATVRVMYHEKPDYISGSEITVNGGLNNLGSVDTSVDTRQLNSASYYSSPQQNYLVNSGHR